MERDINRDCRDKDKGLTLMVVGESLRSVVGFLLHVNVEAVTRADNSSAQHPYLTTVSNRCRVKLTKHKSGTLSVVNGVHPQPCKSYQSQGWSCFVNRVVKSLSAA